MDTINRLLDAADATLARRIATTGALYALSDVLAQFIVPSTAWAPARPALHATTSTATRPRWDAWRTLRLAVYGALVFAPLNSLWLGSVIEHVPGGTVAKVALDQLTMSPFGLFLFLWYTTWLTPPSPAAYPSDRATVVAGASARSSSSSWGALVGLPPSLPAQWRSDALAARTTAARRKIRLDFFPTLRRSWAVWVPVQVLTIGLVPPRERLLFVNFVALLWNAFLSLYVALPPRAPINRHLPG